MLFSTDTILTLILLTAPPTIFGGTAQFGHQTNAHLLNAEHGWMLECMSHRRKAFPCLAFLNSQSNSADQQTVTSKNIKMLSAIVFIAITCQKAAVFMCRLKETPLQSLESKILFDHLWLLADAIFQTERLLNTKLI